VASARRLFPVLLLGCTAFADDPASPKYTAASIVNSASNTTDSYAPNTFLTIYGQNLANMTKAMAQDDILAGTLPTSLGDVTVLLNHVFANIYYVSSLQVNLLVPSSLPPGPITLQLVNRSFAGPPISITLKDSAPGLFQLDAVNVVCTHGNGPVVTPASPARRGEVVVIYATGLGVTSPPAVANKLPTTIAQIVNLPNFQVLLNGSPVDPKAIQYAGVTPGFAGLFQINLRLPDDAPLNPEIRVGFSGGPMSAPGKIIPLQ
jgi:uncharacterized protein (TIGR03437 family)